MKTAIVYDRVNKWGGAERVLLALHEMFPDAPLYTSVYDSKGAPWADAFPQVVPSFLNKLPYFRDKHEWLAPLMPVAFEQFDFGEYDTVISVTSEAAKGIITKPETLHVCYCLTPTRYLWSHYGTYFRGRSLQAVVKPVVGYLRYWDKIAAQRPDVMVAISTEVQRRVRKYYGRESTIIFPPVDTESFHPQDGVNSTVLHSTILSKNNLLKGDKQVYKKEYYLVVSRLVKYKKVDLVIKAFNKLGYRLKIIGTGKEEMYLRKLASENIEFLGFVEEEILAEHYSNSKAFIFPQTEDFGITAVEAQAAGVPVIAHKAGGALDTIVHKETGIFFEEQTEESLMKAVEILENHKFDRKKLSENAQRFSKESFKRRFGKLIDSLLK